MAMSSIYGYQSFRKPFLFPTNHPLRGAEEVFGIPVPFSPWGVRASTGASICLFISSAPWGMALPGAALTPKTRRILFGP
jgi:hypothetical protein